MRIQQINTNRIDMGVAALFMRKSMLDTPAAAISY
jgi:hypothetical protein